MSHHLRLLSIVSLVLFALTPATLLGQAPAYAQLIPSNTNADQDYGYSVGLDGDVAVVGAFRDGASVPLEAGAAYVYRYGNGVWSEEARLRATTPTNLNWFGWSVAVSGDAILVGERFGDEAGTNSGDVYVFRHGAGGWAQEAVLTSPTASSGEDFSYAVALSGDIAVVGAPAADATGQVFVYRHSNGSWSYEATLTASDASPQAMFGYSVAIDGRRIVVGALSAPDGISNQAGKVYIYESIDGQWRERADLFAEDSNNLAGLGVSVGIKGDWVVAGAALNNELGGGAGAAYVYHYDLGVWSFHSKLTALAGQGFFLFGSSVAITEGQIMVGADNWFASGEGSTGKTYLFDYDGTTDVWTESAGFVPDEATVGGKYGHAVAIDDGVMLAGAPDNDGTLDAQGAAFIIGVPNVPTAIEDALPAPAFRIEAPYPNPFSSETSFTITPADDGPVRARLFDLLGREVRSVYDGRLPAGSPATFRIDAGELPAGVYLLRIEGGRGSETHKLVRTH
ncbi:MAG: T9SS type A sorting domain-containing protein [Rhodothermales bacterium]